MQHAVRLPRLLDGQWREARRLSPTALSLMLKKDGASTAEITLPTEDAPLPLLAFLEIYTLKGSAGLFRVAQQSSAGTGDRAQSYSLLHAIDTLRDSLWREQADFSGTVSQFLTGLLSWQTTVYWQLGQCEDTGVYKRAGLNYNHLDALLYELLADRPDYLLSCDFSTWPWTLNFVAASETVDCEMRQTRNLIDARARRSRDGMCNRLYLSIHTTVKKDTAPSQWSGGAHAGEPTGKTTAPEDKTTETETELRIYNDTASQAEYGLIEGTADIDAADVPDADAWAAAYLQSHAVPQLQATSDAWEIVKATGDAWDQFDLGKLARLPLPRPGYPVEAPIESISYPDLIYDPEKVRADMNRRAPKFSEGLASLREETRKAASAAGGAARSAAKAEEMTHWAMVVQKILEALDGSGVTDAWETGITLDAQTGAKIYSLYQGVTSNMAAIQVANNEISLRVRAGDIASAINQTAQSVLIQASKIDLQGLVTASQLQTELASISVTLSESIGTEYIRADVGSFGALYVPQGSVVLWGTGVSFVTKTVVTGISNGTPTTEQIHYLGY